MKLGSIYVVMQRSWQHLENRSNVVLNNYFPHPDTEGLAEKPPALD